MFNSFEKNLFTQIFNTNEFKAWLLSKRWFGDKSTLGNLAFEIIIKYFQNISENIILTIIEVKTEGYSKEYFFPLIIYDKIYDILEDYEKTRENITNLIEKTFSKMIVFNILENSKENVMNLNLLEAEYCIHFWKKMLFDKTISEHFPSYNLDLTLYEEQFEDKENLENVQALVEASLYLNKYDLFLEQLGGGNTTNLLFKLTISKKGSKNKECFSYVLKSYKEYTTRIEPRTLFILVKNNFPNAPKIYGMIKIKGKDTIGILQNVPNIGNIGDIYWREVNKMTIDFYNYIKENSIKNNDLETFNDFVNKYCAESLKVSREIGPYIKKLHDALINEDYNDYSPEIIESRKYLEKYTKKLQEQVLKIQDYMKKREDISFFDSPKIKSILIDILDVIESLKDDFQVEKIKIRPVHQDLHMQQILYNKINGNYYFYFIDFEGDPQLSPEEKRSKFPIEKDLGSFLRSLSYIKFNTLLSFIDEYIVDKSRFEVPQEILYSTYFRKSARITLKQEYVNIVAKLLEYWETKLMGNIFDKSLKLHFTLINYFSIERALHELEYELLFRPNMAIIPILGLKEIIEKRQS